jgi:hypothetical protein
MHQSSGNICDLPATLIPNINQGDEAQKII